MLSRGSCSDGGQNCSGQARRVARIRSKAQKGSPRAEKAFPRLKRGALERLTAMVLLRRRGRREPFASLGGFRFRLRLGRLLDFFPAFVFASHVCKCATKGQLGERQKAEFHSSARLFVDSGAQFRYSEILARCCAWGLCVFTRTCWLMPWIDVPWGWPEQDVGCWIRV
jgi:hypothetical protein